MPKPYEKYKGKISKHCKLGLISSFLTLAGVLVVFFVPYLKTDILLGISADISIFDICKDVFTPREGVDISWLASMPIVLLHAGTLLMCIVDIGRNVDFFIHTDENLMNIYDVVRARTSRRAALIQLAPITFMIAIIVSAGTFVLFIMNSLREEYTSLLICCITGVNIMIIFPIIFVIALLIMEIVRGRFDRKIRSAILREG